MKRIVTLWLFLLLAAPLTTPAQAASDEIFLGLGQRSGITQLVETFVTLLQADKRVGTSFQEADIAHLKEKMVEHFCKIGGGPCAYTGKDMQTIHDGLDITEAQFYAVVEDLQIALERNGVATRIQNKLLARLAPMRRDVVTR